MSWTLARLTANLTADGAWHGLDRYESTAPDSQGAGSIFFPVGGSGAMVTRDQEVLIRVAWCTTTGGFVSGAGTSCTVEPVTIDRLPHPVSGSFQERLSVGEAREASAWTPLLLSVGPAALASVRLSDMVFASAQRVAVYYWAAP
jgi:hypothetical protein